MTDALNPPTHRAIEDAWERASARSHVHPDNPRAIGTHAALEWITGRTLNPPITQEPHPADKEAIRREGHEATMVEIGTQPGDPRYASAAAAVLFWAYGLEPMPVSLRPLH